MDPITAIGIATTAFSAIKKGFEIGNDIENMTGDISRWMGAISHIREAEEKVKNPPLFKKLFDGMSVEQEAIEVFAAKKKAKAMEDELRVFIQFQYGMEAWDELLRIQAKIRKERAAEKLKQEEMRDDITLILLLILLVTLLGVLGVVIFMNV